MESRGIGLETIQCKSNGGNEGKSMYANRCIGQFKLIGALLLLLQDGSLFSRRSHGGRMECTRKRERERFDWNRDCVCFALICLFWK